MSKHEAVDRLMALATEKRADRIPEAPPARAAIEEVPVTTTPVTILPPADADAAHPEPQPGPTAADRGRQLLQAIRPLLPAVAGAMRLVDHGAVQAVARLLPLLGGSPGFHPQPALGSAQQHEQQSRPASDLQSAHQAIRKDLQALTLQLAASDDLLARTRSHLERLAAEQTARDTDLRALADRARLLSAGLIILLMLVVVQMILLIVVLHR